ncbi:MAG: hypothetical protein M0Q38_05770 [Bacteroidales bacterium]|jgi:hypothetical protein|nr:hypothetical protein [Bacteroidales bacterium]
MKRILKFFLISTIALFYSCSPSSRVQRLLMKHPELVKTDTLVLKDTIPIQGIAADTVLYLERISAPVLLSRDRLEVEVWKQHDTLFVKGKCKADTVYRTYRIPVTRIKWVKPDRIDLLLSN